MSASEYVHFNVQVIRQETDKAFQVVLDDGSIHWIPKSQIADPDDYQAGDRGFTLSVTRWIAEQKGIEGDEG